MSPLRYMKQNSFVVQGTKVFVFFIKPNRNPHIVIILKCWFKHIGLILILLGMYIPSLPGCGHPEFINSTSQILYVYNRVPLQFPLNICLHILYQVEIWTLGKMTKIFTFKQWSGLKFLDLANCYISILCPWSCQICIAFHVFPWTSWRKIYHGDAFVLIMYQMGIINNINVVPCMCTLMYIVLLSK